MDIKYSFQKTSWDSIIQGAEIETYDNDHTINDNFFATKITIPRETSITRSLLYIKLNQKKSVSIKDIAGFIRSFPMVTLGFILIIGLLFITTFLGKFILIFNAIVIFIYILFFAYKLTKYLFELTKM
ncbi:hypothetical protein IKN40_05070 [bacterium]|nr:hypothetical protein [bacterium]